MERGRLQELHYIAPVSNVKSIAVRGLLSHKSAARHNPVSVALETVQERREAKTVPGGRPLHEYVNLYVNARNPMLYLRSLGSDHESLCVIRIDASVLDLPGVVVTLENAARGYARFRTPEEAIEALEEELVFAKFWTHPGDPVEEYRHKGAICAEVLVPDRVPPNYLVGAYAPCTPGKTAFDALNTGILVTVNRDMFFEVCQQ